MQLNSLDKFLSLFRSEPLFVRFLSVEADGQDVSDLLIQEGLAVPYEGGTKGKNWCA